MTRAPAPSQLGIELEHAPAKKATHKVDRTATSGAQSPDLKNYLIERDGKRYAGVHLIVDMWEAERLDDLEHVEAALRLCVEAARATLLHIHLHHFSQNNGVSGVAVLAESHISLHTWPEHGYAALDIFMCGDTHPNAAIAVLRRMFKPGRISVSEHLRGGPL